MPQPMTLNDLNDIVKIEKLDPGSSLNFRIFQGNDIVDMEIDEVSEGTDGTICIFLSESQ